MPCLALKELLYAIHAIHTISLALVLKMQWCFRFEKKFDREIILL